MKKQFDLKTAIKSKNMTQEQFAKACGSRRGTLARYFTGERYPRPHMIKTMANLLNIKTETLAAHLLEKQQDS